MHIFLDNFHQGEKYTAQILSHQGELIKEENYTDQNCLSLSSLQTGCLNLDISSGSGRNNDRENLAQVKFTFFGGYHTTYFFRLKNSSTKIAHLVIQTDNELNSHLIKSFRCGYVDHLADKFPKPPEDYDKRRKNSHFNARVDCAPEKESVKTNNDNNQNI